MPNKFSYQMLRDSTTDSVIKITGAFDGLSGQELNTTRISANTLSGAIATNGFLVANNQGGAANTTQAYYDLQLTGVKYLVNFPTANVGGVELFWSGAGSTPTAQYANSATIFHMNMQGEYGLGEQLPSILNNSGLGIPANTGNGDLGVMTTGGTANAAYTIIITLRKNNAMYQRGQFNEPSAFSIKPYGVTP